MELKIKPHQKNVFPLGGILIKGASAVTWLKEIQGLGLSLTEIKIYPVPDVLPNVIWGCLVRFSGSVNGIQFGRHEACQWIEPNLFIPEKSILHPVITTTELGKLLTSEVNIFHPEFGLAELTEELNLHELLAQPALKSDKIIKPQPPTSIPKTIRSFQIQPVAQEDVLKNLEDKVFPKHKAFDDKPLSLLEKGRLAFYKTFLSKGKGSGMSSSETPAKESKFESFLRSIFKSDRLLSKFEQDYEELEKRNQKEVDKLMDLFKNDPDEALKYAIPLDDMGSFRGGEANAPLDLSKRWSDFSLFGSSQSSKGGGTVNLGQNYYQLQNQYNATAQALVKRGEYEKAAFVYMKLLKNFHKAAEVLEDGKHYQEAATIHLKHTGNKLKAAQCYEKGMMMTDAIGIYAQLNENEKVGDLYMAINKRNDAVEYYKKVIDDYKGRSQYVKASLIYKNKMNDESAGQSLLLEGWNTNRDAVNCLNNYFSNINDATLLNQQINTVYTNLNEQNREPFLQVLGYEYKKNNQLAGQIREMAYEIIARQIPVKPSIVSELKDFSPNNKELLKDTLRFKLNQRIKK